jgi:hypothetical protein
VVLIIQGLVSLTDSHETAADRSRGTKQTEETDGREWEGGVRGSIPSSKLTDDVAGALAEREHNV